MSRRPETPAHQHRGTRAVNVIVRIFESVVWRHATDSRPSELPMLERVTRRVLCEATLRCAGSFFLLTGLAKALALLQGSPTLQQYDNLLLVKYEVLFPVVSMLEVVMGLVLIGRWEPFLRITLLFTASCMLLLYHAFSQFVGGSGGCPCMGSLADWLPMSSQTVRHFLQGSLTSFVICSAMLLLDAARKTKHA